jgi:hypothetical protein
MPQQDFLLQHSKSLSAKFNLPIESPSSFFLRPQKKAIKEIHFPK